MLQGIGAGGAAIRYLRFNGGQLTPASLVYRVKRVSSAKPAFEDIFRILPNLARRQPTDAARRYR